MHQAGDVCNFEVQLSGFRGGSKLVLAQHFARQADKNICSTRNLSQNARATSPELFDNELNSIKFAHGKDHKCVKVKLGGSEVLLWKPDEVIDDSSLMQLDVDLGFEGMKEEIGNLEKCGAGKVIGQAEVDALKKKHPLMRAIPSRWVSAYKSESLAGVRIVAKNLNKGISARKLGISSPTPSIEGLHFVLTLAAQRALRLKGLDVSHAFMHSPLSHGLVIVLKLPLSVSMPDGSQAYLLLYKALNGLRDASLHNLNLLSDSIRGVGLASDEVEPCIYQGVVNGELALLVAYVDDLLLCCQSERAEKIVEKAIGKAVPLKETGIILPARHGGGRLIFIGRHVHRGLDDDSLTICVDPKFLDTTFTEFNITKGSASVPDVASQASWTRPWVTRINCKNSLPLHIHDFAEHWANFCGWHSLGTT